MKDEMLEDQKIISEEIKDVEIVGGTVPEETEMLERELGKFNKVGRDYFHVELRRDVDLLASIKNSSRFYSFQLPANLNEFFMKHEESALYWIFETPLLNYLEEHTKNQLGTKSAIYDYKLIKDYFSKWATAKHENQKKMLANSTMSLLRKEGNSGVILNSIFMAILYAFEPSLQNPVKAVDEFKKVKESPAGSKMADKFKTELYYLMEVYSGFAYLSVFNYYDSSIHFSEALKHNPYGMTAKLYLSFTSIKMQQTEIAGYLLKEIYSYDLYRLSFAIENNNAAMFVYFLRNPIIKNIFYYSAFALHTNTIIEKVNESPVSDYSKFINLREKINLLEKLSLDEYYTEEIKKNITFLTKMTGSSEETKHLLFIASLEHLREKFNKTLELIEGATQDKFHLEYKPKLDLFDAKIRDNGMVIDQFLKELQDAKDELKAKLKETISKLEKITFENISVVENRLNNLHLEKEYDPNLSFQNSMTYNFIIALTVFLIGGFAGYSNNLSNTFGDFNGTMGTIIFTGIKWSMLTFAIGFLISLVFSGFVLLERSNQKQRLLQKISAYKNEKDRKIEYVKKEAEMKEKSISENFNDRIELHKASIEDLKRRRATDEIAFKEEAESKIKPISASLKKILEES
jgi:hypothetical protein